MILGMEFFDKVHAFPLPAANSLSIFDKSKACVVPVERAQPSEKALSVMQCRRGFKKNPDHLVSIRQHHKGKDSRSPPSQVPQQARAVHDKGKDAMPQKLPPRWVVEQRTKSSEHEELRKQKRGRRNTNRKKETTTCGVCGGTSPRVKHEKTNGKLRKKSLKEQGRDRDEDAASLGRRGCCGPPNLLTKSPTQSQEC